MLLSTKIIARRVQIAGVVFLCMLGFSGGGGVAQTPQPDTAIGEPQPQVAPPQPAQPKWEVICTTTQAGLDCRAGRALSMGDKGQLIVALRVPPDTKIPEMIVQVPLGVYLPAGVSLQFGDDAAKRLPFESCGPNGCSASYPVTKAEITAMLKGADLTISTQYLKGQPVTIKVPMLGFPAAYAKTQ